MTIELEIGNYPSNLYDLINHFFTEQIINDVNCEFCRIKTNFKIKKSIIKPPKVIFLHFIRFNYVMKNGAARVDKNETLIFHRDSDVNLGRNLSSLLENKTSCRYNITSYINHQGNLFSGHYTT